MLSLMSISSNLSTPPPATVTAPSPPQTPPVRTIPGSYGWPVLGPLSDRLDYFQGPENFFRKRMEKYKSTVYRTNVPPCFPFFTDVNPNVIAVLDVKSFSNLFDMEIVEKKNVLIGDFMPSVKFTGGMRVCTYLDPSEEHHAKVKSFAMDILKRSSSVWVSSLLTSLDTMCTSLENSLSTKGPASLTVPLQRCLFSFLSKSLIGSDPASYSSELDEEGYIMLDKWLALQLLPTVKIGLFQPLEELLFHSFAYPFFLVQSDYNKLAKFIAESGQEVLDLGQAEYGLTQDEIIHNLLFILGFNAFGGFFVFLPTLLKTLGSNTDGVQDRLRKEVREKCGSTSGSDLSFEVVKEMDLLGSFVYEMLRLNPPVPLQYGRARRDFVLQAENAAYEVKKGELLCGYQKVVMRDPNVFDDPEKFNPDRFMGEMGRELLGYLYWSNGPQTGNTGPDNKQCAAKDHVPLTARLFVAYLLRRYDSITCDSSGNIIEAVKAK